MSQVFTSGDPGIGASASASVLLVNIQGCFPLTLTGGLISLLAKDSQESSPALQLENISSSALHLPYGPAFISVPDCWETTAFIIQTFVSKVMPLLFSMLSRFVTAFLFSKHLLIPWLQSPSTVILEPKKIKSLTVSTFFPIYLP